MNDDMLDSRAKLRDWLRRQNEQRRPLTEAEIESAAEKIARIAGLPPETT